MTPEKILRNKIIVPPRLWKLLSENEILAERYCPDDRFYVLDDEGRVHCFEYHGRIPRPDDGEGEGR